jgi:hypothetical protein
VYSVETDREVLKVLTAFNFYHNRWNNVQKYSHLNTMQIETKRSINQITVNNSRIAIFPLSPNLQKWLYK